MCGEHGDDMASTFGQLGSSPHAWGIRGITDCDRDNLRIIPTCVGNTSTDLMRRPIRRDHPHMRGEYWRFRVDTMESTGSSPHAWGVRVGCISIHDSYGIIPTCVGSTLHQSRHSAVCAIHDFIIHSLSPLAVTPYPSPHALLYPGHLYPPGTHDTCSGRWRARAGPGGFARPRWPCRTR